MTAASGDRQRIEPADGAVRGDEHGRGGRGGLLDGRRGNLRGERREKIDGRDCYRVRLIPRGGLQIATRWYDRKTGLLYRAQMPAKTDMGLVPVSMTYEEYRAVAGLKWPVRIRMAVSGQDLLFTADEVKLALQELN